MRSDDLTPLIPRPGQQPEIGYRQGTVIAWDAASGTNQVNVGGTVLDNLPILGGLEATSIRPGDIVGIQRVRSQFFVLGRIAAPDVASDVTVQIEGGAFVPLVQLAGGASAASATNSVLFNATTVGFQAVGGTFFSFNVYTGRLLVLMAAHMLVQDIARMYFGYRLTGPETIEPERARSAFSRGRSSTSTERNAMFAHMHTGLTPGNYTIQGWVEFADSQNLPGIDDGELGSRSLIAFPF